MCGLLHFEQKKCALAEFEMSETHDEKLDLQRLSTVGTLLLISKGYTVSFSLHLIIRYGNLSIIIINPSIIHNKTHLLVSRDWYKL